MARCSFDCCRWCTPPKRCSGCHSVCPEYIEAKKQYEMEKASYEAARAYNRIREGYYQAEIAPRVRRLAAKYH